MEPEIVEPLQEESGGAEEKQTEQTEQAASTPAVIHKSPVDMKDVRIIEYKKDESEETSKSNPAPEGTGNVEEEVGWNGQVEEVAWMEQAEEVIWTE
mmetsp:Transcript_35780/g.54817  ORF Transcript_35780/g.54817 Transcript_35780/m.54817 type:complete len:97 (+) Transcript_35780:2570-2860(+)